MQNIRVIYLYCWTMAITLGYFQFGFGVNYFSSFTTIMYQKYEHVNFINPLGKGKDAFNSIVTACVPFGALIGTMTGGLLASYGRRKGILVICIAIMIGSSLQMIFNFF